MRTEVSCGRAWAPWYRLAAALALILVVLPVTGALGRSDRPAAGGTLKPAPDGNVIDGRYIVVYEPTVPSADAETDRQERSKGFQARLRFRRAVKGFSARLSPGQVKQLRQDPDVAFVAPDRRVEASGTVPLAAGEPTPPAGVRRMQAATSTTTRQASDFGVAVIDTGIDLSHPDLNAVSGTNCVTPGASAQDDEGHGTHVAGTIGAKNNGSGVVGVAPGTKLYGVKVLDSTGSGSWSQIICGLDWVAANSASLKIKVANMSLGGPGSNDNNCGNSDGDPLHLAVCRVSQAGVSQVVAAGNSGWDIGDSPPDTPAVYPEVLTVTAMSDSDGKSGALGPAPSCRTGESDDASASFSNYATRLADRAHMLAAPGVCITSTLRGGGYGPMSGTSMASPHVAGAVALCLGEGGAAGPCAGMSSGQVIEHMRGEAQAHSTSDSGYGFAGDPSRPNLWADYFGYLAHADQDTTPPDTQITAGPSTTSGSTSAQFAFNAGEPGASFECRLDAGAWRACSSPSSYSALAEGSHSFSVRAKDSAGNTDPTPATRSWTVDTTPPDSAIDTGPAGSTNDSTPTFGFSSPDGSARFECRIDGGGWSSCSSPHTLPALPDGAHSFEVRAVDAAGNADASPASRSLTIDTQAPAVTLRSPAPGAATRDATPALSGDAGGAPGDSPTVSVKIYVGSSSSGTPLQTVTALSSAGGWSVELPAALSDGPYTAVAEQADGAGNAGRSVPVNFSVDTAPPDTSLPGGPKPLTNDATPSFELASSEAASRFECRLDGGAWTACSSPHTAQALSDGEHTFAARAVDRAGNVDASPASQAFSVDATAPDTTISVGPQSPTKNTTPTFEFAGSESSSVFECRLDSAAWTSCSSPHRTAELAVGPHSFQVRAIDSAGNPDGSPASREFTVDPESVAALPPSASSQAASGVGQSSATIGGSVDPHGQATTYHFEYGATSTYGSRTAEQDAGAGTGAQAVAAVLTGLSAGTTYHYRLVAANAAGPGVGEDRTFTTATPPPVAAPSPPVTASPPPPAPSPTPAGDRDAPAIFLSVVRQRLTTVLRRGLRVSVGCHERCSIAARLWLDGRTAKRLGLSRRGKAAIVGRAGAALAAAGRRTSSVRLTRAAARRVARLRSITLTLKTTVTDLAGNSRTVSRRLWLRR